MSALSVLGVTHVSDLYPNVKYKLALISALPGIDVRLCVHDLGAGGLYTSFGRGRKISRLMGGLRLLLGTLHVFTRFLFHRTPQVYVTYPAPALALLLGLLPRRIRPVIHLDAFISLYDTVVHDRRMLSAGDWRARLLFRVERRAFMLAEQVLVDTADNARYYADLFALPQQRFRVVPLSIPPLPLDSSPSTARRQRFTCLFIGSLVPLHGIAILLEAVQILAGVPDLEFIIMGDGQDAGVIENFVQQHAPANLHWKRGMHSTDALIAAMRDADLCLGIFGTSAKAGRVLPYKIYYYCAMAKPFITLRTPCLEHYCGNASQYFLSEGGAGAAASLAALIERHHLHDAFHTEAAKAAHALYQTQLSPAVIGQALQELFSSRA